MQQEHQLAKEKQKKVEEELASRTAPVWKETAGNIGIEVSGMGGVLMGPSDQLLSRMTEEQKSSIQELAAFYGHFTCNPEAAIKSGITKNELEEAHDQLNSKWKEVAGISFDDWKLLQSVLVPYLREQEDKGNSARIELGIKDVHVARKITYEEIREAKARPITNEALQKLLDVVKGEE